jgi:hypothetical protein
MSDFPSRQRRTATARERRRLADEAIKLHDAALSAPMPKSALDKVGQAIVLLVEANDELKRRRNPDKKAKAKKMATAALAHARKAGAAIKKYTVKGAKKAARGSVLAAAKTRIADLKRCAKTIGLSQSDLEATAAWKKAKDKLSAAQEKWAEKVNPRRRRNVMGQFGGMKPGTVVEITDEFAKGLRGIAIGDNTEDVKYYRRYDPHGYYLRFAGHPPDMPSYYIPADMVKTSSGPVSSYKAWKKRLQTTSSTKHVRTEKYLHRPVLPQRPERDERDERDDYGTWRTGIVTKFNPSRRRNAGGWNPTFYRVRPKENFLLWGTGIRLDKTKKYWAVDATNQPDWKRKGLIFVQFSYGGKPATKAEALDPHGADGFLLSWKDVVKVNPHPRAMKLNPRGLKKSLQDRIDLANKYIAFAIKHDIWGEDYFGSTWPVVMEFSKLIKVSPTGQTVTIQYNQPHDKPYKEIYYPNKYDGEGEIRYKISGIIRGIKKGAKAEGWTLSHKGQSFSAKKSNPRRRKKPSETEMRAVYVQVYGREFDDPRRKQPPLPLHIAYKAALQALAKRKNPRRRRRNP